MATDTSAPPKHLGNYDILSMIAEGGMGTVYKARSRVTGDIVAVKVIAAHTAKNPVLLQRFEREFQAARVLDHPNVVRAIEYCGTGPYPFLVMEFVDGESLGQRIERAGSVPEAEAVHLMAQVCDGLQRAHKQGLVHRDVKPDNILVTRDGVAKLTDMGLVKDADTDLNLTRTGRGLGTPHYMAPEQFRNAKNVDIRGDIYSLGATLYAAVTGVVPFDHTSPLDCWMRKVRNEFPAPKELNPDISDRVDWAIRRAMSAEPDRRPASCREFLEDLTGQSRVVGQPAAHPGSGSDVWYLVYRDETGESHTVKGGTEAIRNALRDGLLGDASSILVGRSKAGQLQQLHSVPEFRDLVLTPAPMAPAGTPRPAGASGLKLGKASGTVPRAGSARRPVDSADVDIGSLPAEAGSGILGGVRSGRAPQQPSGRYNQPQQPSGRYNQPGPSPPSSRKMAPTPAAETRAETVPDAPTRTPPLARPHLAAAAKRPKKAAPGFDWTPLLVLAVMLLSAVVGFFLFKR